MRLLIVGVGSIGRRHLRNVRQIAPHIHVVAWRSGRSESAPEHVDETVFSLADALKTRPDAALITNPASLHVPTAMALSEAGIDLFIEKPLSHNLENVDALLDLCRRKSLLLMVGYNFRFHHPLLIMRQALLDGSIGRILFLRAEAGQHLSYWRGDADYRISGSGSAELGGGAILELSHEIDYSTWLLGNVSRVTAMARRLGDLDIDVEDAAEILIEFNQGAIGNIHLDMLQHSAVRSCRVVGTNGTLIWDGTTDSVKLFSADSQAWTELHSAAGHDRNAMYLSEMAHFIECVKTRQTPVVTGEDGKRTLEIALATKRAAHEHRAIGL